VFYASIKTIKNIEQKNMLDIGCVTCRYRICEGSKTALSGDLQYIIIAVQNNCVISMEILKILKTFLK